MFSFSRRNPDRRAAEQAYSRIVAHSRDPLFFTDYGVPDTLDGRFELICLHSFLYLHRLKDEGPGGSAVGQCFVDAMFADMDRSLRELGTGDLSVGRQVRRMAQALYGRINAYEDGLAGGDALLGAALARNLFGTVPEPPPFAGPMAAYMRREAARLRHRPADELVRGEVSFGPPPAVPDGAAPAHDAREPL